MNHEMLEAAAGRLADMHIVLQAEAVRIAHNAAIDRAQEIVAEWIANGRDETVLFDRLQDQKRWVR